MTETIPSYQAMMPAVLEALADGQPKSLKQLYEAVTAHYGFTEAQLSLTLPSGKQSYIYNRIGWTKTYLAKAGLVHLPKRGMCQLTAQGAKALASKLPINNDYLTQFASFNDFINARPDDNDDAISPQGHATPQSHGDNSQTPTEMIASAFSALNAALADELLEHIHTLSPKFFEQLVVDLMLAMGYGGSQQDAGKATQYRSDGGIDGIIKEDKLGLDSIYLQAKRYLGNTVGRPDIQAFAGALDMYRARKGVFITTSSFSKDAREFVAMIEKRIVLIDGNELAALMIAHNVGVLGDKAHSRTICR